MKMKLPNPRDLQERKIRHQFGLSPHRAKLVAEFAFGEARA